MSIAGKNSVHFTKKDLQDSKIPSVAFKNLKFAHEATAGQTVINILSLTTPSTGMPASFVQPSAGDLAAARLQTNKNNFRLISSLHNYLEFDSYSITGQSQITLGYPAAEGEVFVGILDNTAKTGLQVIDNNPVVKTVTLPAGQNEIIVGIPFDVNKYPTEQSGAILVYEEGQLLFRNVSNTQSLAGSGDYYEVDNGGPTSNSIMINNTSGVDRSFTILSNGFMAAAPSDSLLTQLQVLSGQLDALIPTVAALAGVPETDFQAAPNDVDQAAFGNRLLQAENDIDVLQDKTLQYLTNLQSLSIADATDTDVGAGTLTLQPGTYLIEYGLRPNVEFSAGAPTDIAVILRVTDDSNVSVVTGLSIGMLGSRYTSTSYRACISNAEELVIAVPTIIKLRVNINVTGGTVSSINANVGYLKATKTA